MKVLTQYVEFVGRFSLLLQLLGEYSVGRGKVEEVSL